MNKKYCPSCKRELPENEFHKDRSRPDGFKWQCKDCFRHSRKKEKLTLTKEQFEKAFKNPELHKIINTQAKRYANKRNEFRKELRQDGWFEGVFQSSSTGELFENARKAVRNAYEREYHARRTREDYIQEHYADDPDLMGNGNYCTEQYRNKLAWENATQNPNGIKKTKEKK